MNKPLTLLLFPLGALLLATFTFAADDPNATRWLSQEQEQALVSSVPPPPEIDSAGDKADLDAVLAAQKGRTPAIIAECVRDQKYNFTLFADVYGKNLSVEKDPKFFAMMKVVLATTRAVNEGAKNKFRRLRPYQQHPDAVHALFPVQGFSYPSGHAMGSFTLATVLGAIFPDKQQAFLDRAAQISQSRVDAGVHNPTDIQEGEVFGKATGAEIIASPVFQQDLAAVKRELGR